MTDITHSPHDGPLTTDGIVEEPTQGGTSVPPEAQAPSPQESRSRRVLKKAGWVAFGVVCLFTFTLLKLPEDRIKNYVQGMITAQLAPKGITFTAESGYVSLGFGVSYVMKNVTLNFPPPEGTAKIDKISVTPSLLPMLLGYQGGSLWVYQGDGSLHASVSFKGSQMSAAFKAKQIDFGKIGALPLAAGIRGSVVATGSGSFSGDMSVPSTLGGDADLTLGKVSLEQQSIVGFNVPRIQISEGRIELSADKGKATIKTLKLGKQASDDLQGSATGDVLLGRNWDSSTVNARINFKLSDALLKSFALIDMLLANGKQPDGSYTCTLTGPLTSPQFLPAGK